MSVSRSDFGAGSSARGGFSGTETLDVSLKLSIPPLPS